ncbi:MAG: hypothetical protein RMM10_05675, partial [Anaerolineae bacterium]|uniref:hypothetical protein n=1 Tax=Thermoflexus sp. TaxID=1969742 RepID=UPI0025F288D6
LAFANRGERSMTFLGRFESGEEAELWVNGKRLRPVKISENFQEDVCPEYPRSIQRCVWVVGAIERGWFEFELPEGAAPPFEFQFPGFGVVELGPERPLSGEVWGDLPSGAFPSGEWRFDPPLWAGHFDIPSLRIGIREIAADGDRMTVTLELRQPPGLLVIGQLPGPGELARVDAAGVQAFPREFPEDLREMHLPRDQTRRTISLVYPLPTAHGPLVFRLEGWPLLRFDPARGVVEEVDWDGQAFVPAPTPTPSPSAIARQEIQARMDRLAEAVANRDFASFRAALAENADVDLRLLERVIGGGGWPLQNPRFRVVDGAFEADEAREVKILLEVALEGFPAEDVRRYRAQADFRKSDGEWRIARWSWTDIPPWTILAGRAWSSAHFVLIGPSDLPEGTARAVLDELEAARADLQAKLPAELFRPRYLALYAPDGETFRRLTGQSPGRTLGVAFSRTFPRIEEEELVGFETGEYMIVLNAEGVRGYRQTDPLFGRQAVLRHELVHVVLAPWTRPWTPGWLVEGAAMTYAGQPFWRELQGQKLEGLGNMTYTVSFGHIGDIFGTATARQYALASAMAEFMRERWGDEAFLALYRSYAGVEPQEIARRMPMVAIGTLVEATWEGIARDLTPERMRQHLGVDPGAFEAEFLRWWQGRR